MKLAFQVDEKYAEAVTRYVVEAVSIMMERDMVAEAIAEFKEKNKLPKKYEKDKAHNNTQEA